MLVDGHDVRDVTLESLRAQIGIVLQETTLFSGTIRDNIAYGRPDASLDEVVAAARAAAAHDFIIGFPAGLRHAGRRARLDAERRPEAAHRHRPRAAAQSAHPDPGRLDQQRRPGDRVPDPAGARPADAGPNLVRDRPAHQHGAERRPDPGARQGPDRRARHARGAAGVVRDLRRHLQLAARRRLGARDARQRRELAEAGVGR